MPAHNLCAGQKKYKMNLHKIVNLWKDDDRIKRLAEHIEKNPADSAYICGLHGSSSAFVIYHLIKRLKKLLFVLLPDTETALHTFNDLEKIYSDSETELLRKKILYFPSAYNNPYDFTNVYNLNLLYRNTVLYRISAKLPPKIIISCPQSFIEPVLKKKEITESSYKLSEGDELSMDYLLELFFFHGFSQTDYVYEPGQFAVRGCIVDVFAYSFERPYRIEFSGHNIKSLRSFNPVTQESVEFHSNIMLLCNTGKNQTLEYQSMIEFIDIPAIFWMPPADDCAELIKKEHEKYEECIKEQKVELQHYPEKYTDAQQFIDNVREFPIIENIVTGSQNFKNVIDFSIKSHPEFAKNFDLLFNTLDDYKKNSIKTFIFCENPVQIKRLDEIIEDISLRKNVQLNNNIQFIRQSLHGGFVDTEENIALLTDHQIFERYHRYKFTERYSGAEAYAVRDLQHITPGDYVVHIDYGIGQYAGLEKIIVNGKEQEAIHIIYRDNDLLCISVHSLHKISKYTGKDGKVPMLDKFGTGAWQRKKYKAKSNVKDIARELVKLYAERKASKGYCFAPDTYLEHEVEASFIFEDTKDQAKAVEDVKTDMESSFPMDRLICGDVGFGKTEVAIRAAFKAAVNGKQTAVLVPTTILALQHYQTFTERLGDFPVRIEYINRFCSSKHLKKILDSLRCGKVDIIIGTHKLLGKEVEFNDLGLLIIDEEQKFGVSAKEKIRQLKVNVDTLTMTATPIPRTLQFSLMGARDLSIINTPPPNRQPVHTEIITFNIARIKDIIMYEVQRGGQVFFINNKIKTIHDIAHTLNKHCPDVKIEVAHGQIPGNALEKIMLNFIDRKFDVLVCTSIIESGIDIPNSNTIIINEAHNFGLSDLYQLRGRVGRSNRKAFCYLITPPLVTLSEQARKRIRALLEFSDLGSGLQVALRDLDIRGGGNLLGAEQSGFISEIGYEMYKKILDEAINEIQTEKNNEEYDFSDPSTFVKECVIVTDMSIHIPDSYVSDFNERFILYKNLDNLTTEKQLLAFENHLRDRFGPLPEQTIELINVVRLRLAARKAGIVKVLLKNSEMTGTFFETDDERFYKSEIYTRILQYVNKNPDHCLMKINNVQQVCITFSNIESVKSALSKIESFLNEG